MKSLIAGLTTTLRFIVRRSKHLSQEYLRLIIASNLSFPRVLPTVKWRIPFWNKTGAWKITLR